MLNECLLFWTVLRNYIDHKKRYDMMLVTLHAAKQFPVGSIGTALYVVCCILVEMYACCASPLSNSGFCYFQARWFVWFYAFW